MTLMAPKGLKAMFQCGEDTIAEPVVTFSNSGDAMVVNLETGQLYVASGEHNFVALAWDDPDR